MSRWNGGHGRGAGRKERELKRAEAEARQATERQRDAESMAPLLAAVARLDYQEGYVAGLFYGKPPEGASADWLNGYRRAQQVRP